MYTDFPCESPIRNRPEIQNRPEINVVYGPDYYKIEGRCVTNRVVRIGEITKQVLGLIPLTPESNMHEDPMVDELPDMPQIPCNTRLVFWVRDPGKQPNYSKGCSEVIISAVLNDPKKRAYVPLLKEAVFLLDKRNYLG